MTESLSNFISPSSVMRAVEAYIAAHALLPNDAGIVVGVSGGPDSLCLLDILRQLAASHDWRIIAAHLDHQLRGDASAQDAEYVASLCEQWGVPCALASSNIGAVATETKRSIEETARIERYRFLAEVARQHGWHHIAVAHHADDQVETVLMHLLRGAGLDGLRGMLPVAPLEGHPNVSLVRPLLGVNRQDIVAYCLDRDIEPRLDRSNLDTTYHRNSIRHELLPALERYNPNIRQALAHTAASLAGDHAIVQDAVNRAWKNALRSQGREAIALDRAALTAMPLGLQRRLVRQAIWQLCSTLRDIGWVHVRDTLQVIGKGSTGDRATLPGGLELVLGYRLVWIAEKGYAPPVETPTISPGASVNLPGVTLLDDDWRLKCWLIDVTELPANWRANADPLLAYIDADSLAGPLTLRTRRTGDRFVPLGETQTRSLRRFMINAKVPAALRDRVPLLTCGDTIVWVIGWRLDARNAVSDATHHVLALRCLRNDRGET